MCPYLDKRQRKNRRGNRVLRHDHPEPGPSRIPRGVFGKHRSCSAFPGLSRKRRRPPTASLLKKGWPISSVHGLVVGGRRQAGKLRRSSDGLGRGCIMTHPRASRHTPSPNLQPSCSSVALPLSSHEPNRRAIVSRARSQDHARIFHLSSYLAPVSRKKPAEQANHPKQKVDNQRQTSHSLQPFPNASESEQHVRAS